MIKNPIGAHYSIKDGYIGALKVALSDGATAVQIFAKSPASAKLREVTEEESLEVSKWEDRKKIRNLVIHGSYLINLSEKELKTESYQMRSISEDLRNAEALGGDGVIIHMGKTLGQAKEKATQNFVNNIKTLIAENKNTKTKIIIENTAGQGTEIGYSMEELADIYKKIGDIDKVKICIDTAHAFGAGYDISDDPSGVAKKIAETVGIKNIACIHLNNSKKELNSRVDRHADIDSGEIKTSGLIKFAETIEKIGGENIPFILEVPEETESYKEQIEKLRKGK